MEDQPISFTRLLTQLLIVSLVTQLARGQTPSCMPQGPCRCVMNDGSGALDISSIGNANGTARFPQSPGYDASLFSYNPCYPANVQTCHNAAVCQSVNNSYVSVGSQDSAQWSFRVHYPVITYSSSDRKVEVMLICEPTFTVPQLTAIGKLPTGVIGMMLTTKCACPGGCGATEPTDNKTILSLSPGSVILIIFFAASCLYLILGTSYNCAKSEKSGREVLPNYGFWSGLPGLILEGFRFTKHAVCCMPSERYQSI